MVSCHSADPLRAPKELRNRVLQTKAFRSKLLVASCILLITRQNHYVQVMCPGVFLCDSPAEWLLLTLFFKLGVGMILAF